MPSDTAPRVDALDRSLVAAIARHTWWSGVGVMDPSAARALITTLAAEQRLSTVRFASVDPVPDVDRYDAWLAAGHHADLEFLVTERDARANPRIRLPNARSVVVVALEHAHERPPDPGGRTGLVARYAWGRDYHNLLGKRVRKLRDRLRERGVQTYGGVDTSPVLERAFAREAGVGFVGKNAMIIAPGRTSWMLLGAFYVSVDVEPDRPIQKDHCGSCRRCLDRCPTDAFVGPRVLDARACIAYWTIEARGLAPRALRPKFGRWVFGCDLCQEVCPHNHHPPECEEPDLLPRNAWLDLDTIVRVPDAALHNRFNGTPLARAGAAGLKRNALVALANLGDDGAVDVARVALGNASPVVRAAAVWCLGRLGDRHVLDLEDADPGVRAELDALREGVA
jgi:epoxyqueuosine reductase